MLDPRAQVDQTTFFALPVGRQSRAGPQPQPRVEPAPQPPVSPPQPLVEPVDPRPFLQVLPAPSPTHSLQAPPAGTAQRGLMVVALLGWSSCLVLLAIGLALLLPRWQVLTSPPDPRPALTGEAGVGPLGSGPELVELDTGMFFEPEVSAEPGPPRPLPPGGEGSRPPTAEPPAGVGGGPGLLRIELAPGVYALKADVQCPGGFHVRVPFESGVAMIHDVPDLDCTLRFKGGAPARFGPVRGGQSLMCDLVGTTATCR